MKRIQTVLLPFALLLVSCGGSTNNGNGAYDYPKSDKQKVIDYLRTKGSDYTIGSSSTSDSGVKITDMIWYDVKEDNFTTTSFVSATGTSSSMSFFGGITWEWGEFRYGTAIGSATYKSSATFTNSFSFSITFSSYPSFTIKSYTVFKEELPSSVSDDVSIAASCLKRAIKNMIDMAPLMGAQSNLW